MNWSKHYFLCSDFAKRAVDIHFEGGYEFRQEYGYSLSTLGSSYRYLGRYVQAEKYLKDALKIARLVDSPSKLRVIVLHRCAQFFNMHGHIQIKDRPAKCYFSQTLIVLRSYHHMLFISLFHRDIFQLVQIPFYVSYYTARYRINNNNNNNNYYYYYYYYYHYLLSLLFQAYQ